MDGTQIQRRDSDSLNSQYCFVLVLKSIHEIKASQETYENLVATFVDVGSILIAYAIGVHQLNIFLGLSYAFFDAWLVVWMRKPITKRIRRLITFFS